MCEFIPKIHLLHDGELSAAAHATVQAHLAACDECSAELAELRNISPAFALLGSESSLSMIERARLDQVLDRQRDEERANELQWIEVARTARMLSALAASILMISSIWLIEIPSGHTTAISPVVVAVSPRDFSSPDKIPGADERIAAEIPAWERIAATLRVDPRPEDASSYEIGVADARTFNDNSPDGPVADWIIAGLDNRLGSNH